MVSRDFRTTPGMGPSSRNATGGIEMFRPLMTLALVGLASLSFSTPANAASDCVGKFNMTADADGDGFCAEPATPVDIDGNTATGVKADYAAAGFPLDCDDGHANMFPGNTEIYGDGIDQDCSGADATLPVSGPALDRFKATYGGSYTDDVFAKEYARCNTATECTPDPITGTFTLAEGYVFEDFVLGDGVTYGKDGLREIATEVDYQNYLHLRGSAHSGGIGSKRSREIATEEAAAAEERVRADLALTDGRVDDLETWQASVNRDYERDSGDYTSINGRFRADEAALEDLTDEVHGAYGEFDSLAGRLDAQEESLRGVSSRTATAQADATSALDTANANSETGVYAEIGVLGTGVFGAGLPEVDSVTGDPTGDMARNGAGFGGGGEVRVGAQLPGARTGVFANMAVIGDGGDAPGNSIEAGFEGLGEIGDSGVYFGGFAAYLRHQTQIDALSVNAAEQGPIAGLSFYAKIPTSKPHLSTGFFARVGAGPSSLGFTGSTPDGMVVVDGIAVQGTIDLGWVIGGNSASVR